MSKFQLLEQINYPEDLKKLSVKDLKKLAGELRQFIIESISRTPGHFGASLGVVELTIALHYVFNAPYDRIVWDVGHQAYGHKILTGRRQNFHTLRQLGGISGFPYIFESEYDAFSVGHSSTSISAALGMAIAAKLKGEDDRNIIAVIGDGAMTAGLAYEGLNNAGASNANILIILNDNNMAIDPNVGALSRYLINFTTSQTYNKLKDEVWNLLGAAKKAGKNVRKIIQSIETGLKSALLCQSNFFEGLNLRYFGPIDGHNIELLVNTLKHLKDIKGPKLLHIKTQKGKGYKYAELDQPKWHSTSAPFDIATGKPIVQDNTPKPPKFQDVFGKTIMELARKNDKIVAITPAMPTGSSLRFMMEDDELKDRAFDVGIAEQHAVTFAAGLAREGLKPYVTIYSTFLQRAYDQVIHDVALQNLPVVFCIDRAGLVGADGPTHHGVYDLTFMRVVPNMIVSAPMDEIEMRNLMYTAQFVDQPMSIRYPRGRGSIIDWQKGMKRVEIGKGRKLKDGKDVAILSIGTIGVETRKAIEILEGQNYSIAHYDMRFVKPLDTQILDEVFERFNKIITVEENSVIGGFGAAVLEYAAQKGYKGNIKILGVKDEFIEHGKPEELRKLCGIDSQGIAEAVKNFVESQRNVHQLKYDLNKN